MSGRWAGNAGCVSVADSGCDLVVGCGHGQFARPALRNDGTFDVSGTYRVEAGPVAITPAPPASFHGVVVGSTLTVTVVPSGGQAASYKFVFSGVAGNCGVPCV